MWSAKLITKMLIRVSNLRLSDDVLVRNVTEYGVSRARTFVRAQLVLSVTPIAPTFSKAVLKNMLRMEVQGFFRSV